MLFRTAVIAALLAVTPALATLNERNIVEEPVELDIRSDLDEDALLARDVEDLERRFGILKGIKAAFKIGKAINGAVHHHHKHHKRDFDDEELFERDLEFDEELYERDFEGDEELFERDFDDETLVLRDVEDLERRFGIIKGIKAAFKIGKAINGAVHHHKHHKRDFDEEELFERDLESEELFERDLESEELFERDFGDLDELD